MFRTPNYSEERSLSVRRVVVRSWDGMVLHDWRRGLFSDVRVILAPGRVAIIEYVGLVAHYQHVPSTAESVEVYE